MAKVTCRICKSKIEKSEAYIIEKKSEKTGRVTREFYCSEQEYIKDKEEKSLWLSKI